MKKLALLFFCIAVLFLSCDGSVKSGYPRSLTIGNNWDKMKAVGAMSYSEVFRARSVSGKALSDDAVFIAVNEDGQIEDIVLLETKVSNPKQQVFVLQFPVGEFDMVIFDPDAGNCKIFEIKHSDKVVPYQYRHLKDVKKCADTEHRFGSILGKYVLYRGESRVVDGIQYLNVEEYLRNLV